MEKKPCNDAVIHLRMLSDQSSNYHTSLDYIIKNMTMTSDEKIFIINMLNDWFKYKYIYHHSYCHTYEK
jgi:hypothetical protein